MAFDSHKVKIKKFQVSLHFKLFKKSKKTFPLLAQAPKTFKNKICWSILGLPSTFSEALRNAHLINMQNFKVKFWNWGSFCMFHNLEQNAMCPNFFSPKALHTTAQCLGQLYFLKVTHRFLRVGLGLAASWEPSSALLKSA